jgi:ABC-type nitrate/sulfonate/bicarbonate transport system substrate-binding protein
VIAVPGRQPGVRKEVHAGFIPLVDCAPLVIAKELGFDAAQGFSLILHKDVSWANIRDKAEAGVLDCAIMLAPMPLASTLGLGGRAAVPMIAAMATSLNGNAITVSNALYDEMQREDRASAEAGGMRAASSLACVVARRRVEGLEPLTLGMVYPFSSHNYDLRYWLAAAGIDPDNDVNLVVVPPPLIAGSLKSGRIDGFCVGEPWNSVAVAEGNGVIVATKSELWAESPEKVLGLRLEFADRHPDLTSSLIRALHLACAWLDEPGNRPAAAAILEDPRYVGIPKNILMRVLADDLKPGSDQGDRATKDAVIFSKHGANFPWVSHATWLLTQMIRWGQVRVPFDIADVARRVYRPDLYRAAVAGLGVEAPKADKKTEGGGAFFGSETFNPDAPVEYLKRLELRDTNVDLAMFAR